MKWMRPSGVEIETNDRDVTIKYCESLGFKRIDANDDTSKEGPKEGTKAWFVAKLTEEGVEFNEADKKADLEAIYNKSQESKE